MGNSIEKSGVLSILVELGIPDPYIKTQLLKVRGVTTKNDLMRTSLGTLHKAGFTLQDRMIILAWQCKRPSHDGGGRI
jgi:hypothetical protein